MSLGDVARAARRALANAFDDGASAGGNGSDDDANLDVSERMERAAVEANARHRKAQRSEMRAQRRAQLNVDSGKMRDARLHAAQIVNARRQKEDALRQAVRVNSLQRAHERQLADVRDAVFVADMASERNAALDNLNVPAMKELVAATEAGNKQLVATNRHRQALEQLVTSETNPNDSYGGGDGHDGNANERAIDDVLREFTSKRDSLQSLPNTPLLEPQSSSLSSNSFDSQANLEQRLAALQGKQ